MASLVIADTDVVIDFFSGAPPFAENLTKLVEEGRLAISAITVFELFAGVTSAKRLKQIEIFCESVPVFELDLLAAAHAAQVYTDLRSRGKSVGNQDILIAGICLASGLPLLTRNTAHFASIKGLELA